MLKKLSESIPITDLVIVGAVQDIGADAAKRMPASMRHRYSQPVKYLLGNGLQVDGRIRGLTRPKLAERLASEIRYIANRMMFADQWENNGVPHWSISTHFSIS